MINNLKRKIIKFYSRLFNKVDDSEIWDLDNTMAEFILPRLKRYNELNDCHPGDLTKEQWDEIIDKIIYSLENVKNDSQYYAWKNDDDTIEKIIKHEESIQEGLDLLGKYFRGFWL